MKVVFFLVLAILAVAVGVSLFSLALMLLWNYIAVGVGHPEAQITFWIAMAINLLLSLISNKFRVSVETKER